MTDFFRVTGKEVSQPCGHFSPKNTIFGGFRTQIFFFTFGPPEESELGNKKWKVPKKVIFLVSKKPGFPRFPPKISKITT